MGKPNESICNRFWYQLRHSRMTSFPSDFHQFRLLLLTIPEFTNEATLRHAVSLLPTTAIDLLWSCEEWLRVPENCIGLKTYLRSIENWGKPDWNRVQRLLMVLAIICENMNDREDQTAKKLLEAPAANWSKLPDKLRYLVPVAEKYGREYSALCIRLLSGYPLLGEVEDELRKTGNQILLSSHAPEINKYLSLKGESCEEYEALYLLGNLMGLFDIAGIKIEE